jgi:sulfite exporter TauE/SafE
MEDNQRLTIFLAPGVAVIFGIIASVVGWVLIRTRRPRTWWFAISAIALVLMGLNAFISADSTSTGIWLNVMHLVAAGAIVPTIAGFFSRPAA